MIEINKIHLRFLFLCFWPVFGVGWRSSKAFLVGSIVELSSLVFLSSGNLRCCSRSYNSFFPLFSAISSSVRNKETFFLAAAARLIKWNEHKKSQKSLFAFFSGEIHYEVIVEISHFPFIWTKKTMMREKCEWNWVDAFSFCAYSGISLA